MKVLTIIKIQDSVTLLTKYLIVFFVNLLVFTNLTIVIKKLQLIC